MNHRLLLPQVLSSSLLHRVIAINNPWIGSVRWKRREPKRKPMWMAMAPTKLFQIPVKVKLPKDEEEQVEHLHWVYQSELLSIRDYCRDHFYLPAKQSGGLSAEQVQEEETEHVQLLKENEDENRIVAQRREERVAQDRASLEHDLLQAEDERRSFEKSLELEAKSLLEAELKRSTTYITKETLDACIEEALSNPVNYDFAIERDGTIVTDGSIHVNALIPSAIPNTSSNVKMGMIQLEEKVKLKPKKIYYDPMKMGSNCI